MNINKNFILAAKGRNRHPGSCFTLEIPNEFKIKHDLSVDHFTYKIKYCFKENEHQWHVYVLTGPNNMYDYTYIGMLNEETGEYGHYDRSKIQETAWSVRFIKRILHCLWKNEFASLLANAFDLHHEGRCGRCGKKLTVPSSILTGLGPICESIT